MEVGEQRGRGAEEQGGRKYKLMHESCILSLMYLKTNTSNQAKMIPLVKAIVRSL
jgi:hypothetical protein